MAGSQPKTERLSLRKLNNRQGQLLEGLSWIPADAVFDEQEVDYLVCDNLDSLANKLIVEKAGHLRGLSIKFLFKRSGGLRAGKAILGKCVRPSGLTRFFSGQDFVVWVAADHARTLRLTSRQIEALLYHELQHAGRDENGRPVLLGHDFEAFCAEVEEYGFWKQDLKKAAEIFKKQLELFGDIGPLKASIQKGGSEHELER